MTEQEIASCVHLQDLLLDNYKMKTLEESGKCVSLEVENNGCSSDLSWYRVELVRNTMKNIYEKCGWTVTEGGYADQKFLLTLNLVPAKGNESDQRRRMAVGVVRNIATKQKERQISIEDYLRMREEDILSVEANAQLAKATVHFELLHVGYQSCVNLDFSAPPVLNRGSSNRGVVFCLYNYARIATILNKHASGVERSEYPPLPALDAQLAQTLFEMSPEMKLVRLCLMRFTKVLSDVEPDAEGRLPQPHLLCRYLSEVAHPISRYYRSHHVLTEPSAHLLPVMHARLHLLRAIHRVLGYAFHLLDLQPQDTM
ncbi:Hypothetical predicted protein [Cloeon dipterum]|uniref:DALR anticodon binding domain-containing protein n=1 Tax=Cloeon dipterum TaxID=197152 RepID=A0A8S1D3R4_9INSE|nr:Hypothetical predicted protein [Cloeon dipterum]